MDRRTTYSLMARKQIGTRGLEDLGIRYAQLRMVLGGKKDGERMIHSAQEYASKLLEKCGLKYTPVSPNQESCYSHLIGNDLGGAINKFYRRMIRDLEALGYLRLVTIQHRVIVENLLTLLLAREAALNGDKRRFLRIVPRLQKLNANVVGILKLHLYSAASSDVNASSSSRRSSSTALEPQHPS